MEETMITEPSRRAAISGITRWHSQWLERTLAAMILSKASSGISSCGPTALQIRRTGCTMKKAISAAISFGLAGCVMSPPRVAGYPPPRPVHHVAPATGQQPKPAAARLASVKPLGQGELTAQTVENY